MSCGNNAPSLRRVLSTCNHTSGNDIVVSDGDEIRGTNLVLRGKETLTLAAPELIIQAERNVVKGDVVVDNVVVEHDAEVKGVLYAQQIKSDETPEASSISLGDGAIGIDANLTVNGGLRVTDHIETNLLKPIDPASETSIALSTDNIDITAKTTTVKGDLTVTNSVNEGDTTIYGNSNILGDVDVGGDARIKGSARIDKDVSIGGEISVNTIKPVGPETRPAIFFLPNTIVLDADSVRVGDLTGNFIYAKSNLTVDGDSFLNGNLFLKGFVEINGDLNVSTIKGPVSGPLVVDAGQVNLSGALSVADGADFGGFISVPGIFGVDGVLSVDATQVTLTGQIATEAVNTKSLAVNTITSALPDAPILIGTDLDVNGDAAVKNLGVAAELSTNLIKSHVPEVPIVVDAISLDASQTVSATQFVVRSENPVIIADQPLEIISPNVIIPNNLTVNGNITGNLPPPANASIEFSDLALDGVDGQPSLVSTDWTVYSTWTQVVTAGLEVDLLPDGGFKFSAPGFYRVTGYLAFNSDDANAVSVTRFFGGQAPTLGTNLIGSGYSQLLGLIQVADPEQVWYFQYKTSVAGTLGKASGLDASIYASLQLSRA